MLYLCSLLQTVQYYKKKHIYPSAEAIRVSWYHMCEVPPSLSSTCSCVACVAGTLSPSEERMQVALEELQDLKGVWSELSKVWEQIDDLKERPWLSVQPRKVSSCCDLSVTLLVTVVCTWT